MREPSPQLPALLEVFNFRSKREVVRHCKTLVVSRTDFVALVLGAQRGALSPYKYANHFAETTPKHLLPKKEEHDAIAANGVGPLRTKQAQKFTRKIFQLFVEKRSLAAHLFYTDDAEYWHLFYFDSGDTSEHKNHWKHGSHIHYVSDLWTELSLSSAWAQVLSGELGFANKLHIRYKGT